MKVLMVEDEPAICELVAGQLAQHDFEITIASSCADALRAIESAPVDIVILDLGLPDGSGFDVLDHLGHVGRSGPDPHVIILSGTSEEHTRVDAFDRGADDYVIKPFSHRELVARVLAARRRKSRDAVISVGPVTIDRRALAATLDGEPLELTRKEFELFAFLAAHPGAVFSREQLLEAVWQSTTEWQQASTVTEHVSRLRSKIEDDPARPRIINTVRGVGYRLDRRAGRS